MFSLPVGRNLEREQEREIERGKEIMDRCGGEIMQSEVERERNIILSDNGKERQGDNGIEVH